MKDNTVIHGAIRVVHRERSIAEKAPGFIVIEADGVNVERAGNSLSKGFLHLRLLGVIWCNIVEPVCVY
jgi:hypothetical protein